MLEPDALARLAFDALSDKQVEDIIILDLRPVSLVTDYFVIGTVGSPRQMRAAVNAVAEQVAEAADRKPVHIEGETESGWMLMDFSDVVVHVFDAERRAFYALEEMWDEAPLVARMR